MRTMFSKAGYGAGTFNIGNVGNWDVSNVTDMSSMFAQAGYSATTWNIGDLSNWDVSNVINVNAVEDMELERRRIGSAEKQLYMEFEEKENIESDDLNKIAKIVLERIIDKLQGTDFSKNNTLDVKNQVEKLILQA
jgi:hypothetical protein